MVDLRQTIEEAKRYIENSGDDKYFIGLDTLRVMLAEGADGTLNAPQAGRGYVHTVKYEGVTFISVSDEEIKYK